MVSRPALSSVQVKFFPQVPEFTIALSSASTVVPSEIVIMIANSKLKILFLIALSPSISFIWQLLNAIILYNLSPCHVKINRPHL